MKYKNYLVLICILIIVGCAKQPERTPEALSEDPFSQPLRVAIPNCGPEYRYQYDIEKSLTSVEEVVSFLEDVRAIPLPADFFSKNKDNFIKSKVENGKLIFTLNTLGLPTRDCFDGYEEIVVSDIGEISFYACCGK